MNNKSHRKLPDARYTFSPPPMSHLTDRGDKYGARYGSAGDVSTGARGDSPDRGQRLFGSTQNLDRRGDAASSKRKPAHSTGRSMTPDTRSYMMEKEVTESQNRKLQMEITTLQTENKLMKEKYNRATAKISELESQLHDTQEDLNALQDSLNKEMAELSAKTRNEIDKDREQLESKIIALTKDNETLKAEVSSLEKQLDSSHRVTDKARQNSEKTKTLEAHKTEIASLKEELNTVKALLEQSERHLREEEERHGGDSKQLLQLTELKNALQQQADTGGSGVVTDKQLKSLEKRLKVTEERLHQERADRANNLSSVEDKLLTENARLQAVEKEFTRQLHREKDRNRNLEQRLKQVREENEKLRLAMPFDDSVLLSNKETYDIPYSSHSNQRAETLRISDDLNYILSQIEKQDGLQSGQEEEIIPMLWNKRELAYKQLREYELQLKELRLEDNNIVDGLKNLRDTYGQAESKLKQMEDQVEDTRAQMATLEATYKEQLTQLVQERHEAFARLKTAEDIMAAVRIENEMLRNSLTGHQVITDSKHKTDTGHSEALQLEVTSLGSKVAQLTRQNKLLEGELSTAHVQLEARNKALEDAQSELELAYRQIQEEGDEDRKQQKIDKLTAQVNSLQTDLKLTTDKYINLNTEKSKLDSEIANLKKTTEAPKPVKHPGTETVDSKVLRELKDSLAEKEGRVSSLTIQLDEAENHLQKTRQDLYIEQEHTAELEAEVETLQHTVNQRAQMFEALSGTEREQHAQYQLLKETLDSVTQELSHKHAQIISLDVNISSQKDRNAELERELYELKQQRSGDGEPDREEVRSGDRLRIHELELERASLKQELSQAYSAIQASEEQFRGLQTENKQLEQEVVKEKTVVLQVTAEKGEIEQHLEELAEEHDALIQEKNQAEEDLIKLENKLQEILHKYEAEARKQQGNFDKQYGALTPEGKQMASELDSLRQVLEGKEKEVDMLNDKLNRQLIEIDFLNRKVDLVHHDSIANREDVARMISELTLKMKEAVATREVNQFLAGERTKLQTEKNHLERELEQERQNTDKRKIEINEVIRKVETSELQQQSMKMNDQNKTTTIATLEADLRNANQNLTTTQTENTQLKNRLEHLQEDLKNMTAINATLEKRFEMEQNSKEVQTKDDEISELQEEIRNLKVELDSNKGQLLLTKDTVQKLTQDKGSIYQDYEGLCRSLTDKERQLNEVRDRSEEKVEHIKQEYMSEKLRLENDRTTAEKERDIVKQEMDNLNEELKQKEVQLSTFGKTLSDLEAVTRQKNELESLLKQVEGSAGDSKLLLEGQRRELVSLHEALAKQQEETTRLQVTNRTLEMDLKSEKDTLSREIHDLKLTLDELKSQHENERSYLNDNLVQTQTQLRTIEASYASAIEARDSLQAQKRLADSTQEDLQSKLSDESTARRLVEQSVGSLRLQLEDLRNEKTMSDARLVETRNQLTKCEKQLTSEQSKNKKLAGRVQELVTMTESSDANVKSKDEQVDILHKEITKLRQMVDTQKQSLTAKMKKAALEFKQKLDHVQDEKDKLSGQVQKLSTDLDLCREQIASKNKVNLKLQEQIVTLEDCVREGQTKLKQAQDSLKRESENQSQMSHRYSAQDEELKRLRSFLAKKVEESGEADKSMWHEMNRVIQELSSQMQSHLDAKKSEKGNNSETQLIQRYKKQLAEVQGDLSTEKSLHQITKTSLQALDEDCTRLRHQLHKLRRRDKSPVPDKKYKNRMEAINAIIARSQTQAQALLAAGGYTDDINNSRVHGNPNRGYQSPNRPDSPDNSYASDDLSIASLPPMPFSQYTSQVRPAEAKY